MLSKPALFWGNGDLENVKVIWSRAFGQDGFALINVLGVNVFQACIATGRSCEKVHIPHLLAKYSFFGHFYWREQA